MNNKQRTFRWRDLSLAAKVVFLVLLVSFIVFFTNIVMYIQLNRVTDTLEQVYESNADLTELSEALERVHTSMYGYLMVKSSDSLESYYKNEDEYRALLDGLNTQIMENPVMLLEKNIRSMSESYLETAAETISAKRGRNVEKYRDSYEKAQELYDFLNLQIYELNSQQFRSNSNSFLSLQRTIRYLGVSSTAMILVIMGISSLMLFLMVRDVLSPLSRLADTARIVGEGNFHVKMPDTDAGDEVGVLTTTFNTMVHSLEEYMNLTRENMENERRMKERELLMETHLKEAQLKYLQSQINPHFLFNSLNAAAQLAMLEDAEKTSVFVEKMADFFRYNVKKGTEDATLLEELEAVENYIYILNVRFAGDIHFYKDVMVPLPDVRLPSMILQPIVENSVNHGIRNIDREGEIWLSIREEDAYIVIRIRDNGKGIAPDRLEKIRRGDILQEDKGGDSAGIGMQNVISRLELYYSRGGLLYIDSPGPDLGTEVTIRLPLRSEDRGVAAAGGQDE